MINLIKTKRKMNKKGIGMRPFVMSFIVVIFFTLMLVGFITTFLGQTNPNSEVLNSKYKLNSSYNTMNTNLNAVSTVSNTISKDLAGSAPDPIGFVFLIFKGAFEIPITLFTSVVGLMTSFSGIFITVFLANMGLPPALTTGIQLLFGGLLITLVILVIAFIRSGASER